MCLATDVERKARRNEEIDEESYHTVRVDQHGWPIMSGNNIQLVELLRLVDWKQTIAVKEGEQPHLPEFMTVELTVTIKREFFQNLARKALRNKRGTTSLAHGNIVAKAVRRND